MFLANLHALHDVNLLVEIILACSAPQKRKREKNENKVWRQGGEKRGKVGREIEGGRGERERGRECERLRGRDRQKNTKKHI